MQVKTTAHHQIDKITCLVVSHESNQVDQDESESACEWDPMIVMGRKAFVPDQKITQVCLVILFF